MSLYGLVAGESEPGRLRACSITLAESLGKLEGEGGALPRTGALHRQAAAHFLGGVGRAVQTKAMAGLSSGEARVEYPVRFSFAMPTPLSRTSIRTRSGDARKVRTPTCLPSPPDCSQASLALRIEVDENLQRLVFLDDDRPAFLKFANQLNTGVGKGPFIQAEGIFDKVGQLDGFGEFCQA